jgi:hypothetical protein
LKIKGKLITLVLVAAIVPLLLTGIGSYTLGRSILKDLIGGDLTAASKEAMLSLEEFLDGVLIDTGAWSR